MTPTIHVPHAPSHLPVPLDPALERSLLWTFTRLAGIDANGVPSTVEIEAADAPGPELKSALQDRLRTLDRWLAPIGVGAVLPLVHRLYTGLNPRKGEVEMLASRIATYPDVLRELPAFAIEAAVRDFIAGAEGDRIFVPTAAQVRTAAAARADGARQERRSISLVLTARIKAPPSTPERRAQLAAAARRAFRIPETDQRSGVKAAPPPEPGDLADLGREILERASMNRWRADQASAKGASMPEERFRDENAA